jgi:uncharacterized lipoprotein YbaY
MLSTRRVRPLFLALTLIMLLAAACSPGLPPLIRGPEAPTQPPAQPAPTEPVPTALPGAQAPKVDATAAVTGTATMTQTTTLDVSPPMTGTLTAEPTPAMTAITGQVTYRQRIALAPDAIVEVVLLDASRADAPAVTLGSQTIEARGAQVPVPFSVEYDLSQIDPAGLYTMRATIKEGGKLTWTSADMIPVITRGAPTDQIEIMVQPASAPRAKKEMGTLQGVVTYLQRIALSPDAVVEVTLQDVSLADAPAKVIARQMIETKGAQVPIPFELEYDPVAINPAMRYSIMARIAENGKLTWISTRYNPVLTKDAPVNNVEIIVEQVPATAGGGQSATATLSGTVSYMQRIALPPNAVVEVTLQDVSRADAPATVIARQTIQANGQQVPIPFALEYDPSAINPAMRYAVSARITEDGKLTWISTTMNPVLTRGAPDNDVEIIVEQVTGS